MSLDFLYLNEPDMIRAGVLDMDRCLASMDELFRLMGKGDYLMGGPYENSHGLMLWFPLEKRTGNMPVAGPDRRFMAMPAYVGGRFHVCGQKWYGSNRENTKKGLPRSILTVMLNDVDTGAPLSLMSANLLSSMRTGAVPGVATKYLQSTDASVIGVVGAGVISRSCLLAIAKTIRNGKEVRVYDIVPSQSERFCAEMQSQISIPLRSVSAMQDAVVDCDIVSIAASGASPVVIEDQWIKEGAVIEISGSADFSESCYLNNRIVMDNWLMHKEWLDELRDEPDRLTNINAGHPSAKLLQLVASGKKNISDIVSLSDLIEKPALGRINDKEKIIFFTGGMATEDVAWGFDVYQEALRLGIGQKLNLWDQPHWA